MQAEGHWQEAGAYLARQGQALEAAGAENYSAIMDKVRFGA